MATDVFGDLQEWGQVLVTLDKIKTSRTLDDHQHGLARLVRYKGNWRLQGAALRCAAEVSCPSDILIADTLNTMVSGETPLPLRILAADALGSLVPKYTADGNSEFDIERVRETMQAVADRPQAPIFAQALEQALAGTASQATEGR